MNAEYFDLRVRLASWLLSGMALVAVLRLNLLPALFAGLLVFVLVHLLAPRLQRHFASERARLAAVIVLATVVASFTTAAVIGAIAFFKSDAGSLSALFAKMAQIIEDARATLPSWAIDMIPVDPDDLRMATVELLREHASELRNVGKEAAVTLAYILVGLIIGAMVATQDAHGGRPLGPVGVALQERVRRLAEAFRRIVFAQVRISVLNTVFTAIYLVVALPLFGVHLPLTKTLILITLIAGLLPVVGNLISNVVIVVVSLAHSPHAALASLIFLVVVHKFEYFLNARIVGSQINARAWELLTAMLLMEAVFGMTGVVAAPIVYAWLKDELTRAGLF
ncbi:AI-2E family transporter [Sulfurisoma sediminicola]|uniref:Putative PurR-regulated permease PerM n=1 Tax=Sulfurisoma sediminicola TaxID=1381557 RepID=A0A497X858_9PROT|nr:AI-2E family transporter [Sulfurisoma sediminicola]RLJ62137.1 putative PurR-regulated permease PerM [Sulfurisoma sediminicola]